MDNKKTQKKSFTKVIYINFNIIFLRLNLSKKKYYKIKFAQTRTSYKNIKINY